MTVVTDVGSPTEFDVAVIGGGHNGLIAANYLAREGRRTVLIEAGPALGGMTTSGYFFPEAPQHVMHPCAVDVIMMNATDIPRELQLSKFGYRTVEPDPPYVYLHPDGLVVPFWRDPVLTAKGIRVLSAHDATAYIDFANLLETLCSIAVPAMNTQIHRVDVKNVLRTVRAAAKGRRRLGDITQFATASALQTVDERFTHPAVRSALLAMAASAGPVDKPGSSLSFLLLGLMHRSGVSRPVGGMASLIDSLAASFASHQGHVRTGVAVKQIDVRDGKVRGVRLDNGEFIRARAVLSTADPHTTLGTLLPEGLLDLKTTARVDHLPANAEGVSPFKVDMALSGHAAFPHHQLDGVDLRMPVIMIGTVDEIVDSFAIASRGEVPDRPAMWVCIPSAADPQQAPAGQDTVYLYPLAMPLDPPGGWDATATIAEKVTVSMAGNYISRLEELELSRLVETPPMLAARTRAWHGCLVHVDFTLFRTGPLRPAWGLSGYTTPVDGLFLGGAGSHPGGGVSGLPGKLASGRVDRYLRKNS